MAGSARVFGGGRWARGQILMTPDWLGRPRVECAAARLRALNPRLEVVAIPSFRTISTKRRAHCPVCGAGQYPPIYMRRKLGAAESGFRDSNQKRRQI